MRTRIVLLVAGCLLLVACAGPARASRQWPDGDDGSGLAPSAEESATRLLQFNFRQVLPRDAIRPIYKPEFVAPNRAQVSDDELVLGVFLGGEARAYPITPLNSREIVNDLVGGVPIVVTW